MVDVRPYSSPDLREGTSASHFYSSLLETPTKGSRSLRRPLKVFLVLLSGLLAFRLLVAIMTSTGLISTWDWAELLDQKPRYQVDVWLGVSKKEHGPPRLAAQRSSFPWSPHMLAWQRTAFHFQPEQNWMNDPNGPLYYKEWYHLFYQYNPGGATWGSPIVWGHAISKDLIHWRHLPVAMSADKWYDKNGVWTGSATILPDGSIVMLYTGSTNETVQVQNLAFPADPSNPLLVDWVKYSGNPVLVPPPGIDKHDFRDPTTAWLTTEGKWRIIIGSKLNRTGISLVYDTKDFKYFELRGEWLHEVSGTGMWECVDFFPVSESEEIGLDTSAKGSGVKHVVKASFDDDRNDYYSIGTYDDQVAKWVPDNPSMDVGLGLRFDYGKFYASKTFYDPIRKRRVIWGWVPELDSVSTDVQRGWASLQSIPRTVSLDRKTGKNLLLWPVPEIEKLRLKSWEYKDVWVDSGSVVPLQVGGSSQLDIVAEFEINEEVLEKLDESQDEYDCQGSGGVQKRGHLGPFGFLVHADDGFSELTAIYFYVAKGPGGTLKTFFCADSSRSTLGNPVLKPVYGSTVPVLKDEKLTMRILVDHSIIESFAQGGRTCITSRVYPTKAIYDQAKVFLFNNATEARVKASMKIWQMDSAYIHSYPTELLK